MGKFTKILTALCAVMLMSANAFAMSLIQPYGYTMPLDKLAENDSSLSANNAIFGNTEGVIGYSDSEGFNFHITGNGPLAIAFGGQGYSGESLTQPLSYGKTINRYKFSLSISDRYAEVSKIEFLDGCTFVLDTDGTYKTVGWKMFYGVDERTDYIVNLLSIGKTSQVTLNYDETYTFITEIDIPNSTASIRVEDEYGNIKGAVSTTSESMVAVRNGFRARTFPCYDVVIKEMTTMRENFIIKNRDLIVDSENITAVMDVANDCAEIAAYGELKKTSPILMLGQFDSEGRLLSYDISSVNLPPRAVNTAAPEYKTVTVTIEKNRSFDHAEAYIWTDIDEMIAYSDILSAN